MANHVHGTTGRHRESCLDLARANFKPVEQLLEQLNDLIVKGHDGAYEIELKDGMRETAMNTYNVRYSLHNAGEARLSLSFIMAGENADMILFQGHERSVPRNVQANPGQVDQHVYRLSEMDELKIAVQDKMLAYLD